MIRCFALVMLLVGCRASGAFSCETSEQCRLNGVVGTCELTGFCSFVDGSCPSGSRYDSLAGGTLAGTCVGGTDPDATLDPDADPDGDPDGDLILTSDDNCPLIANADQHDEDLDQKGDACDPCPQLAGDAADADGDGDGIGDGCDPRPNMPGDLLVLFDPFSSGTGLPAGWTAIAGTAGNWSIAGDALVNEALEATNMVVLDAGAGRLSIDLAVDVTVVNVTPDTIGVGAVVENDGTQASMYMCFAQTQTTLQFSQTFGPGTTTLATSAPVGPTLPGRYRIATYYDGTAVRCRFGGANAPADLVTNQTPLGQNRVGFRARQTGVRIEYVAIYRSP